MAVMEIHLSQTYITCTLCQWATPCPNMTEYTKSDILNTKT